MGTGRPHCSHQPQVEQLCASVRQRVVGTGPPHCPHRFRFRFRLREAQPVVLPVTRCSCGHALDEAATHYIHCRGAPRVGGGNFFTSIHDAMLREVANMLRTVYPRGQVVSEDYIGAMSYSPLHRPDVTILDAGGFGVHTLVELTVFRVTVAANVRSSTRMGPDGRLVHGTIGAALARDAEGWLW